MNDMKNEKITLLNVDEIRKAIVEETNSEAKAIATKCFTRADAFNSLSKGEVFKLVTSISNDGSPDRYNDLEMAGNYIKVAKKPWKVRKSAMKYLQDCINEAWIEAMKDEDLTYFVKENRKSLQNGGIKQKHEENIECKMLKLVKVPSNKGSANKTYQLPTITGNLIEISKSSNNNNFYTLDKDAKNEFFVDAEKVAEMVDKERNSLEDLDYAFWEEVNSRLEAKKHKMHFSAYLKAIKDGTLKKAS